MTESQFPVLEVSYVAWKDIGYCCVAEAYEYWMDLKIYEFYLYKDPGEEEWDGIAPLAAGLAPSGYAFNHTQYNCSPDPVKKIDEAQVFLHGSIKWDGCSNLHFDEQDNVCLHFCGREEATNIGVLFDRLYDLAAKMIPSWTSSLGE